MPDPKPNTVAACLQQIDQLTKLVEQLGIRVNALPAALPVATSATSANVPSSWSQPRTSSEDAQRKAVESALQTTKSVLLAEIRAELNKEHTSTLRVKNLTSSFLNLNLAH